MVTTALKNGRVSGDDFDPKHCFSDFLTQVRLAGSLNDAQAARKARNRLESVYKSPLVNTDGTHGGYLVAPEFSHQLLKTVEEDSLFRARGALVVKVNGRTHQLPVPDVTTSPGTVGVPSFFGGFTLSWQAEGNTIAESEPKWRQVQLSPNNLAGYAVCSNNWLNDSGGGFEQWLKIMFGRAVAWHQDYFFLNGLGTGQPTGLIGTTGNKMPGTIYVTRNTGSHVKPVDIKTMLSRLLPYSWEAAVMAISPTVVLDLMNQADGASVVNWITNVPIPRSTGDNVCGYCGPIPIIVSSKVPALGTVGDVTLFDPRLYAIADRMEVMIDASEHVNYTANQTIFRVISRVDGQPWFSQPITMPDTTTTVGPYVCLQ